MTNFVKKIKAFLKIDEALAEGRIHHIDALKGLLMICLVLVHSIQTTDPNHDNNLLYLITYPFLMPLFMLLSGFIVSKQLNSTLLNYLKKSTVRLLVPFIVWYFISYVFVRFQTDISLSAYLFDLMKSPANGLWFLCVLFWSRLLLFAALKIARYKNWLRWENYFVVVAILLSRISSTEFLGFTEIKAYFVYYAAGFFICKYLDVLIDKRRIIYALSVVVFPILIFSWRREQFPTFYPILLQVVNDKSIARLIVSIYKYVVAISGMALSSFILERIHQTRFYFFLCWVGTMSLDIYVCHQYFIFGFGNGVWQYFADTAVALTCSLALTLLLMKRFKITRLLLLGQSR
jgi:fucose 4-O-acetylase-like acetyltransferase